MSLIYWDTMLFVYWLEGSSDFANRVGELHERMAIRGDRLCTSVFTLGELLVAPKKHGDTTLETKLGEFFASSELDVLPFTVATAAGYAWIRGSLGVRPADALHLACAAEAKVDLYLTNDLAVRRLVVPGIQFIDGIETTALG